MSSMVKDHIIHTMSRIPTGGHDIPTDAVRLLDPGGGGR